jgi:hypothetical protein
MRSEGLLLVLTVLVGAWGPVPRRPAPSPSVELPPPQPIATGRYQVGAYDFPGWPTYEKWRVLNAFPERVPLLGYYQEGDPAVMNWQIKWAVEHGISFFVFDWYWDLDAIREVFGEAAAMHADRTPKDLGLHVPQVPCPGRPCSPPPSGPVRAPVTE